MNFSTRLLELQKASSFSKKDIYTRCKISRVAYYRYENGERYPSYEALLALADFFGVSLDYLVGRTDNPEINR